MHALFVTTHHVPTLPRSHTISPYALSHCLALSRSHTESRSLSHQLSHGIFLCQRLTSSRFIPHTSDCVSRDRTIQRTDTEPRTVRRTIQRTGNTHCFCANCCCAHTHCCANHCCTTAAPYSTPLITPTTAALILHHTAHHSSHQPLLHQSLLNQPLLHRPLLHRPLLH